MGLTYIVGLARMVAAAAPSSRSAELSSWEASTPRARHASMPRARQRCGSPRTYAQHSACVPCIAYVEALARSGHVSSMRLVCIGQPARPAGRRFVSHAPHRAATVTCARRDKKAAEPPAQASESAAPARSDELEQQPATADAFSTAPPAYPLYGATAAPSSPPLAQQQLQQQQPQQAYQAVPPQQQQQLYQPPPPPPPPPASGPPAYVWIAVGAAVMWIFGKVQEFRRNPLSFMSGMLGAAGGAGGGAGGAAGGPDMAAMMKQFQQMQAQGRGGGFQPPPPMGGAPTGPTINTTASTVQPSGRDGAKFQERSKATAAADAAGAPAAADGAADGAADAAPSSSAAVVADAAAAAPAEAAPAAPAAGFFTDTTPKQPAGGAAPRDPEQSEKMVDNLLEMVAANPEMQKQMEKHLPEGQFGPEVWEWLRQSPEMRKQMAKQLATQDLDLSLIHI